MMLYRDEIPGAGSLLLRRIVVGKHAEIIATFCKACAEDLETGQVLCFQRSLAVGEIVGIKSEHDESQESGTKTHK